ncbi:unnamed protein product, partial [Mesorhabditis spiculigera]
MKDDTFCVMVSIMVGVVGIFAYFGFDIMVFLAETIMHSVKDRCPDCIIDFAGYYAQCLLYACFTVANLVAPVFLARFGSKKTILAAICCFTIYSSNFLLIRNYIFFPCSAIAGIGAALFYCGTGAYAAKHSTEATLARTQALSFMLMMSSMLVSGNYMIVSSALTKDSGKRNSSHNENDASYREFSDAEINTLKIGMMASSVLAIILCLLLPSRRIKGSLYVKATNITIRAQLGLVYKALKNPGLTKLIPHYIFCGAFTCFMNSIYTTSVSFTHIFAHEDNLVAFVCMSMSVGELLIGVAMGLISRRIKGFGLMPAMIMTLVWFTIGFQYVDSSQYCYVFTSQLYGNPKNQSNFWFQWKDVTWMMGGQKYMRYGCATTRTTYSGWLMCVVGPEECNPDVGYDSQLTLEPNSDDAAKLTTILYQNRTVLPVYVSLPTFTCRRFTAIRPYPFYETPETGITGLGWAGHCQTVIYLMDMGMTGKFTNMRIEQAAGTYMGGHDFINNWSNMVKPKYFGSIVTWQWQKHYREMAYTCRGDQCNEMITPDMYPQPTIECALGSGQTAYDKKYNSLCVGQLCFISFSQSWTNEYNFRQQIAQSYAVAERGCFMQNTIRGEGRVEVGQVAWMYANQPWVTIFCDEPACNRDLTTVWASVDRHKNPLPPFTPYYSFEHNDTPPYGRAHDTDPNLTFLDFGVSFLKRRAVEPAASAKTAFRPFLGWSFVG